jgi:DnaJ-class molecular chaperone
MHLEEQQNEDNIQMEESKLTNTELCDICKGSGSQGDGLCSSCNGRGLI